MANNSMTNWNEIRDEFPVCKKMVYLNPAGGSPVSKSAAGEAVRFYNEMLENGDTCWDEWLIRTEGVREKLANFINAGKDEIAFTTNTSHGMNHVVQILKGHGSVLTMRDEFPSSTFPWLNQGVEVLFVEPEKGVYSLDRIEKALTPEVKILVSSYVQYRTGFRQDLEKLGAFCRERNLIFVVNATQALGIFPVDVRKCNIDFLVFTGLKWLTTGYGIGGLFVNRKWLDRSLPYAGWRSAVNPGLMDNQLLDLKHEASVLEAGSPHFPTVFALGGALDLFNRIGKEEIQSRVISLTKILRRELEGLSLKIVSPSGENQLSGITVIKMDTPGILVKALREKGIFVSARGEGIRVSVSFFNNEEDIHSLISALRELL
jgi:cysteine desulfurase / selenocysteine lyase